MALKQIHLQITHEEVAQLQSLAARRNVSVSALIRERLRFTPTELVELGHYANWKPYPPPRTVLREVERHLGVTR